MKRTRALEDAHSLPQDWRGVHFWSIDVVLLVHELC